VQENKNGPCSKKTRAGSERKVVESLLLVGYSHNGNKVPDRMSEIKITLAKHVAEISQNKKENSAVL
jgi:hypothetical protein